MFLKRLLIIVFVVLLFFVAAAYFLIPSTLTVQNVTNIKCNLIGASRIINDWRNAFYVHTDTSFSLNGYNYSIVKRFSNGADFFVSNNDKLYTAKVTLMPHSLDTSLLIWTATCKTGNNLISKITTYVRLKALKNNMYKVANKLTYYLDKDSNIYKYKINYTTLTDTFLISIKHTFLSHPSTDEVYGIIDKLKNYAKNKDAKQTNYPMLNLVRTDSSFTIMVGLPVNKSLPAFGDIQPKRLSPMKDKILTTEIIGGEANVQNAYKQMELYMQDHSLTSPVIPFEFLVTERNKESDTLKWHTVIYYPII